MSRNHHLGGGGGGALRSINREGTILRQGTIFKTMRAFSSTCNKDMKMREHISK